MPWSWRIFGHHRSETKQPRSKLAFLYRIYNFTVIDIGLHVVVVLLGRILKWRAALRLFYRWILPLTIARNWKVVDDSHAMLVMEHELFRHIEIEVFVPRSKLQPATDLLIDVVSVFGGESQFKSDQSESLLNSAGQKESSRIARRTVLSSLPDLLPPRVARRNDAQFRVPKRSCRGR